MGGGKVSTAKHITKGDDARARHCSDFHVIRKPHINQAARRNVIEVLLQPDGNNADVSAFPMKQGTE